VLGAAAQQPRTEQCNPPLPPPLCCKQLCAGSASKHEAQTEGGWHETGKAAVHVKQAAVMHSIRCIQPCSCCCLRPSRAQREAVVGLKRNRATWGQGRCLQVERSRAHESCCCFACVLHDACELIYSASENTCSLSMYVSTVGLGAGRLFALALAVPTTGLVPLFYRLSSTKVNQQNHQRTI
jgi:hypothetical protein